MVQTASPSWVRTHAVAALRGALEQFRPAIVLDQHGYAASYEENIVPTVRREDFEADLMAGDGNELAGKFRAAHSSSALAVNCFGPFRRHPDDLVLLGMRGFPAPAFERKCPTGLRGGRAPNLDVLIEGRNAVIGIESKLTEFLGPHRAEFSPAYAKQILDDRREQGWFREMLRLADAPDAYALLDAAQLIKHAFGLARTFRNRPVTLLYIFWEPTNAADHPVFAEHRREIAEFADRVAGSTPAFAAQSYPELWRSWDEGAPDWLAEHLSHLRARYAVTI
ncbi:MAG TPA: hypothetical protein VFJ13_12175 [Paracoccaceae bacterium]|nr:hypothetical protein [Paracoccaceae bacterium]